MRTDLGSSRTPDLIQGPPCNHNIHSAPVTLTCGQGGEVHWFGMSKSGAWLSSQTTMPGSGGGNGTRVGVRGRAQVVYGAPLPVTSLLPRVQTRDCRVVVMVQRTPPSLGVPWGRTGGPWTQGKQTDRWTTGTPPDLGGGGCTNEALGLYLSRAAGVRMVRRGAHGAITRLCDQLLVPRCVGEGN